MAADTGHDDRSAESRRIIERIARETEPNRFYRLGARTANRARNHLGAADVDQHDWIEVWGTRIGRTLGILIVCALLFWAASQLFSGA
jgi:hypothetical protein